MTEKTKAKPTHTAYTVRHYTNSNGEPASHWMEIGSAWAHKKDAKGFDIILEAMPLDGRIVVRLNEPKARPSA